MKPLQAGVIGLGVGRAHARGYARSPHAALVALCDSDEARLREIAQEFNVSPQACYTDYHRMLAQHPLDIVSVCVPNALHAAVSVTALEAGAHVMCEKPMAPSTAEARQMLDAARRARRHLMVSYNYRYRADTQWMVRMVRGGRLGEIYHASVSWRRETGIPGWGWVGSKPVSGGGALIDLGVHVLDLALWMLGFPAVSSVSGEIRSAFGPRGLKTWTRQPVAATPGSFEVEDGAVGLIRLVGGGTIALQATWAEHRAPQDDRIGVELQGTEGTLVLDIPNYTKEDTLRFFTEIENQPVTVIPRLRWNAPAYHHEALMMETVEKLAQGETPSVDGTQGLAAVRILEGLYRSAQTGHEVVLEGTEGRG
jgi:predicted dehydrogenase